MNHYINLYKNWKYNEFDDKDINKYVELQKKLNVTNKFKKVTLCILALVIVLQFFFNAEYIALQINVVTLTFLIIVAYITNHIIAYLLHLWAYKKVEDKPYIFHQGPLDRLFLFFISPDFAYASWFKNDIKHKHKYCHRSNCSTSCLRDEYGEGTCLKAWDNIKIKNKFFIELSNWGNLIVSIILSVLCIILFENNSLLLAFCLLIIIRTVSRAIEIIYAFYKDIAGVYDKVFASKDNKEVYYVHGWKNSILLKSSRLSLAIHSLIEMIILYSVIYYFLSKFICVNYLNENIIALSTDKSDFINFFLYSISVSLFNFSFTSFPSAYWLMAHVSQIFLSFILTILSIAGYLGINAITLERENKFYIETHKILNKRG